MTDFGMSDAVSDLTHRLEGQTFDTILTARSVANMGVVRLLLRVGAINREVSYVVQATYESTYAADPSTTVREVFTASHFEDAAMRYFETLDNLTHTRKNELRAELQHYNAAFTESGGRGVELAETIDSLQAELDELSYLR